MDGRGVQVWTRLAPTRSSCSASQHPIGSRFMSIDTTKVLKSTPKDRTRICVRPPITSLLTPAILLPTLSFQSHMPQQPPPRPESLSSNTAGTASDSYLPAIAGTSSHPFPIPVLSFSSLVLPELARPLQQTTNASELFRSQPNTFDISTSTSSASRPMSRITGSSPSRV
ncbi:hypothetical protein BDP27DRAFT_210428 [Rhodocollybia butyracea]|uniref:Uncharacterized protein n=1 Tax=Rhodocollybia butyracea TaxID=206335 RepID=A0A9P5U1Q4_9AGAR|nr:hypothetical protein BDP27DRAFT_210428 [Rhodocollybia butyracea]